MGKARTVEISFYSEKLSLDFNSDIILPGLLIAEDISLIDYFEKMELSPYQNLLTELQKLKKEYGLNDWLYYELLKKITDQIYIHQGPLKQQASLWFFLTQSGYDTRLSYLDDNLWIYAWSEDDIFETPMIVDQERNYINLTSVNNAQKSPELLKLLLYQPGTGGAPFSFSLDKLPSLPTQIKTREVYFKLKERTFRIELEVDSTLFEIMKNYPAIAENEYFRVPMSEVAYQSLIPKLRFMLKDQSIPEALSTLVAFTRTGFQYKDDKEVFGRSKPMIAEELFHYPYSDCEDRSVLFYFLVKEILDLPMLIIAYPDHLTIAVASETIQGPAIEFNEKKYFICDPTGPSQSNVIGIPPTGYERIPFEIIGTYK